MMILREKSNNDKEVIILKITKILSIKMEIFYIKTIRCTISIKSIVNYKLIIPLAIEHSYKSIIIVIYIVARMYIIRPVLFG